VFKKTPAHTSYSYPTVLIVTLGDLRNNFFDLGWDTFDDATKLRKRTIELNNGRAAMMGILALMVHEQLGVSLIPSFASSEYVL